MKFDIKHEADKAIRWIRENYKVVGYTVLSIVLFVSSIWLIRVITSKITSGASFIFGFIIGVVVSYFGIMQVAAYLERKGTAQAYKEIGKMKARGMR